MSASSYDFRKLQFDREIERLHAQLALTWAQEQRKYVQFGVRDGMQVLNLGGGPGFEAASLLDWLPTCKVTLVDNAAEMSARAQHTLAAYDAARWQIKDASIMALPLPDASMDCAIARYLFQHLTDPFGAAREVWRVLKPGGIFVVTDIDQELMRIIDPGDPNRQAREQEMIARQAERGGNRLIGRQLPQIVRDAGFSNIQLEMAVAHSDVQGWEVYERLLAPDRAWVQPLIDAGAVTLDEVLAEEERYARFRAAPHPIFLTQLFMVSGTKP
jgi:ubiquinone/menaquinone biosynthesis C-methylase UbiE